MDYTLSGSVFVTFDFVGFHHWFDAPDEVSYLRNDHRHLFKCRVEVSVEHQDRELEYHMLKRDIVQFMLPPRTRHGEMALGSMSCEMIAQTLLARLREEYPDRPYYRVEVSEDGENGSIVEARAQ